MAYLRQKRYLVQLPEGAAISTRNGVEWAEWKNHAGAVKCGPLIRKPDGRLMVERHTEAWCIRGRDAAGKQFEISTGCTNKKLAERKLAAHEDVRERVRAGLVSPEDVRALSWVNVALLRHLDDWRTWQTERALHKNTVKTRDAYLREMFTALKWHTVRDLDRAGAENWTHRRMQARKNSPRTYNAIVAAAHAFGAWLLRQGRMQRNPFDGWVSLNEAVDKRRERRAMTEPELAAFLDAAAERPLAQRLRAWPTMNKESRARYQAQGIERALVYRVLLGTGLRWGELRSITIAQALLDENPPCLLLHARSEKNRHGGKIPLRADLCAAIVEHLKALAENRPARMSDGEWQRRPLFTMQPSGLRCLNKDLAWAKVEKRDGNGKVLDVHALRHTFGTMLALSGVSLVITQRAMRHSTPDLTANIYTHVGLGHIREACESMPNITQKSETVGIASPGAAEESAAAVVPSPLTSAPRNTMQPYGQTATREQLETLSREELINIITKGLEGTCDN